MTIVITIHDAYSNRNNVYKMLMQYLQTLDSALEENDLYSMNRDEIFIECFNQVTAVDVSFWLGKTFPQIVTIKEVRIPELVPAIEF